MKQEKRTSVAKINTEQVDYQTRLPRDTVDAVGCFNSFGLPKLAWLSWLMWNFSVSSYETWQHPLHPIPGSGIWDLVSIDNFAELQNQR